MEKPMPSKLTCQWTDGTEVEVNLYQVHNVFAVFNVDKPVAAFWSKTAAEEALDEIHDHIWKIAGQPQGAVTLDASMQFHLVEIPLQALAFLLGA
jgi:hypothetical protein